MQDTQEAIRWGARTLVVIGALVSVGIGCGPPLSADSHTSDSSGQGLASAEAAPVGTIRNCTITLAPVERVQVDPDGSRHVTLLRDPQAPYTPTMTCSTSPDTTQGAASAPVVPYEANQTKIGEDFTGTNFSGSMLVWLADSPYGCRKYSCGLFGWSTCYEAFYAGTLSGIWNNSIRSTKTYSGCVRNVFWDGYNFTGYRKEVNIDTGDLGAPMASSRKWCVSGDSFCN